MNAEATKEVEIDRIELLYNEQRLADLEDQFGKSSEIKRHVKTSAKLYEIRTALRYWNGERATHRTCDCTWERLDAYASTHDLSAEEADAL